MRGHEGPGHRRPWGDSVSPAGQHGHKGESWWATAPRAVPPLGQERSGSVLLGCGLSVTEQSFSRLYLTRRPALKAPEGRVRRLRKWGPGCAPAWLSLHGFPPLPLTRVRFRAHWLAHSPPCTHLLDPFSVH